MITVEGPDATQPATLSARGERTRAAILEAALDLFEEHGYAGTTLRGVAERAGVSVGNAYHYFSSKDDLIQGFYARLLDEHRVAVAGVLGRGTTFEASLRGVEEAWLDVARPYHANATQIAANAFDRTSPLSPFSGASSTTRDGAIEIYADLVAATNVRADSQIREVLPRLLWHYHLMVVLFWTQDDSHEQSATRMFISRTTQMLDTLLPLTRLPGLRSQAREFVTLLELLP
jgi:AcrR family transcriptional regulator